VAAIDYRHAPASRWPAQIDDVRTALAWLCAHGHEFGADPARVTAIAVVSGVGPLLQNSQTRRATAVSLGAMSLGGP